MHGAYHNNVISKGIIGKQSQFPVLLPNAGDLWSNIIAMELPFPHNPSLLEPYIHVIYPLNLILIKDTWYLRGKNSENMQLLNVLVCNLANFEKMVY